MKYVDLKITQQTKSTNYKKPEQTKKILMFEKPSSEKCPYKLIEFYLQKLPEGILCLFPKPLKNFSEGDWYSKKEVLGKNTLHDSMKIISKEASLSITYTNHCIRSSVVTSLSSAGMSPQDIKIVTGHKRIESVERYNKKVSVAKKMKLSHTLTSCLAEKEFFVDIQSENCIQQQQE